MKGDLTCEQTFMLDTNICSFIMREQPEAVIRRLVQTVLHNHRIVVSAITYAEMRFGTINKKASPRHAQMVDAFCARLDAILGSDSSRRNHGNKGCVSHPRDANRA